MIQTLSSAYLPSHSLLGMSGKDFDFTFFPQATLSTFYGQRVLGRVEIVSDKKAAFQLLFYPPTFFLIWLVYR